MPDSLSTSPTFRREHQFSIRALAGLVRVSGMHEPETGLPQFGFRAAFRATRRYSFEIGLSRWAGHVTGDDRVNDYYTMTHERLLMLDLNMLRSVSFQRGKHILALGLALSGCWGTEWRSYRAWLLPGNAPVWAVDRGEYFAVSPNIGYRLNLYQNRISVGPEYMLRYYSKRQSPEHNFNLLVGMNF